MQEHGIEPNATLHHFTHPQWFDALGGFESEGSVEIFVGWARKAVELFGSRIRLWATFNEPTVRRPALRVEATHALGRGRRASGRAGGCSVRLLWTA